MNSEGIGGKKWSEKSSGNKNDEKRAKEKKQVEIKATQCKKIITVYRQYIDFYFTPPQISGF